MTTIQGATMRAPLVPLLTVNDLEQLFSIHRRTIARLCERGELPAPIKVGGSKRWRADDIYQAVNVLRAGTTLSSNEISRATV